MFFISFKHDIQNSLLNDVGINEQILSIIKANNQISAKELSEQLGISSRQCERIIAEFKERGILVRKGSRKSGYWVVKHG